MALIQPMTPWRVHVLVLRDSTSLVPIGFVDTLRKSADLAHSKGDRERGVEVSLVSPSSVKTVATAGGIRLKCDSSIAEVGASDLVLVPALDPDVLTHLELNRPVVPWLKRMYERATDIASACTGAFLLAEAGLLDGRAATTHWAFQDVFCARYPHVRLQPEAVIVDQGRVVTAGGATSFLNLALYLVEKLLGAATARAASKMFLIDINKSPQGAYAILGPQRSHRDEVILRAQDLIESQIDRPVSVDAIARDVAMSSRNFVRRFKAATGIAPSKYLQRIRVEAAKRELETGRESISVVAGRVGYSDAVAFRRVFKREVGLTPVEYRSRYGVRLHKNRPFAVGFRGTDAGRC